MKKINIAELLKDCPKGMELDCTMYENVRFDKISEDKNSVYPIFCYITDNKGNCSGISFTENGCPSKRFGAKCVIFPKGKTSWEGFVPPYEFKNEDERVRKAILTGLIDCRDAPDLGWSDFGGIEIDDCIAWVEKQGEQKSNHCEKCDHIMLNCQNIPCIKTFDKGKSALEAIQEEKVDNANKIEPNIDTHFGKPIDKVEPKFEVGDKIAQKNSACTTMLITKVGDEFYYSNTEGSVGVLPISEQDNWELVPNKFDITTLKPFKSSVLVRNSKDQYWIPAFWGYKAKDGYVTTFGHCNYCIPFEANEHILGTKDECSEFYKTWE